MCACVCVCVCVIAKTVLDQEYVTQHLLRYLNITTSYNLEHVF